MGQAGILHLVKVNSFMIISGFESPASNLLVVWGYIILP